MLTVFAKGCGGAGRGRFEEEEEAEQVQQEDGAAEEEEEDRVEEKEEKRRRTAARGRSRRRGGYDAIQIADALGYNIFPVRTGCTYKDFETRGKNTNSKASCEETTAVEIRKSSKQKHRIRKKRAMRRRKHRTRCRRAPMKQQMAGKLRKIFKGKETYRKVIERSQETCDDQIQKLTKSSDKKITSQIKSEIKGLQGSLASSVQWQQRNLSELFFQKKPWVLKNFPGQDFVNRCTARIVKANPGFV
eukprot:jgi/Picre1/32171/NNA_007517.t1